MTLSKIVNWSGWDGVVLLWRAFVLLTLFGIVFVLWDVREALDKLEAEIRHVGYYVDRANAHVQPLEYRD